MSYSASQSFSKYYYLSITKKTCAETETKLDSISSIWDNDHILRLDEKKWYCLWCNKSFQGINATMALAYILGKKGMHIKVVMFLRKNLI